MSRRYSSAWGKLVVPEFYPVVEVQEDWVLHDEFMGTKDKFWYQSPDSDKHWLFKHPRANSGEHWAEKIAAEVADLLGVMHAKVELANFEEGIGSTTKSFVRNGLELIHGNEILAWVMSNYDVDARFGQSRHTLDNIWVALDKAFIMPEAGEIAKRSFAGYLILDALIGNTDRHHENWGILRRRTGNGWKGFLAPSYDHASSLGRELQDERRNLLLSENRVAAYAEGGHGGIFWSEQARRGPSPLQLVRHAITKYPTLFQIPMERLGRVNENLLREIIWRIPVDWMSSSARLFAAEQMCYNFSELNRLRKAFR